MNPKNLAGQSFHQWTVLKAAGTDAQGHRLWLCQCQCGTQRVLPAYSLTGARSRSCRCTRSQSVRNLQERNALVLKHLTLSRQQCWLNVGQLPYLRHQIEDAVQEGYLALIRAAELWRDDGRATFATYAKRAIVNWLRRSRALRWPSHIVTRSRSQLE